LMRRLGVQPNTRILPVSIKCASSFHCRRCERRGSLTGCSHTAAMSAEVDEDKKSMRTRI
jgi:hypothetical protein